MGESKEQWSAADIFKARVLDAWDKYPKDEGGNDYLFLDVIEALEFHEQFVVVADAFELTADARAFLDRARKEGVL